METTFSQRELHTVRIHSDWHKKRGSTKEKMDRPTPMRKEQAWMVYTPFLLLKMMTLTYVNLSAMMPGSWLLIFLSPYYGRCCMSHF
jgi:hypothetical protein